MLTFDETYLYKIQTLSNLLNRTFDQALRKHARITLSQLMVLAAIAQHPGCNQRHIAGFLRLSAVAVKRQADTAKHHRWIKAAEQHGRGEALRLTPKGHRLLTEALQALETHVLDIFEEHNRSLTLMQHLDLLSANAKEVLGKTQQDKNV